MNDLPPDKSDAQAFLDRYPGVPWIVLLVGIVTLAGGLVAWCQR